MTVDILALIKIIIYLGSAVIILWEANLTMIRKKKIAMFLPFLLIGATFCFRASFIFYGILSKWGGLIEYIDAIAILGILLLVRREKCFR